jgi:hypothetical protein
MLALEAEQARGGPGSGPGRSVLAVTAPADWSPSLIGTTVAWPAQPGGRGADGSDNMISTVGSSPGALAQDLRAFLSWALTSGTAQLGPVNFQPLPASVVTQAQAQIAKFTG